MENIIDITEKLNDSNKISDADLDKIVETAKENTPEEVLKMRESIENADEIDSNPEGFEPEIRDISLESSYEDLLAGNMEDLPESMSNIFDVADGNYVSDEDVDERVKQNAAAMMNLSEEEMIIFMNVIAKYRKKEISNVFPEMPQTVKSMIINLATEQGIPFSEYNKMARMFLDEIISQAELDEVFVDFEKSLDEALKIPSIADMYSEHTRMVMDEKIPEIIEKIKDEEPERAQLLMDIKDQFNHAYSLDLLKIHFEENARTRKLMRRDHDDPIKYCDEINFKNKDSKFKMPDCRAIGPALCRVFLIDVSEGSRIAEMKIEEIDLNKFGILMCRSCINLNQDNILDAAYIYYLLKNITMLNLTNENKTPFAAELINNICDIIEFIREKEAEFNASNMSKSNRKQK